ncbi:sialic acid binding Ig-like lectin 15, like [Osmerus mordax]|uniref:sialic acid binding Ig-like lectin 15, like n=1 Tax=Osmerus mordax TaxID=8014 RepID=UPI0035100B6A
MSGTVFRPEIESFRPQILLTWRVMWTLLLLWVIPGVLSQVWHMTTAPVVNGTVGGDVVLPCTFTHPQQNTYFGVITVQWLFRRSNAMPFFECKMQNITQRKPYRCLDPESSQRFFIHDDPRESKLSLLVRNLTLTDNGDYYCRVELEYNKFQLKSPTHLNVTAPVQILSLTWDRTASGSGNGSLCCIAEGNPRPSISWLLSGQEEPSGQQEVPGDYQVKSSIPYYTQHQYTCRADNRLGRAEASFPPRASCLSVALSACGVMLVLLLGVVAVFLLRRRGILRLCPSDNRCEEQTKPGQSCECPVYANSTDLEKRPERSDLEEIGADEMELVYSVIHITCPSLHRLPHVSTADEGVNYASVTFS